MKAPENANVIEWPASTMWFDEDGILYSLPKPGAPQPATREESQKEIDEFRKLTG